jgi:cytoskeletal protein CcmA (bactofilin family)
MKTPLLFATLLVAFPPALSAADAPVAVAPDQIVIGGSVRHSLPVKGDLIGFGGSVEVLAPVEGNAILTGGDVRIAEAVRGDFYSAGGNVQVEAPIGRNARVAGGNVDIGPKGSVGGNLSVVGGTVVVRGPVTGNIQAASGDVLVDAAVGGDVSVAAGTLHVGPNARIAGRVTLRGNGDTVIDPAALIGGGVTREPGGRVEKRTGASEHRGDADGSWWWTLGMMVLAGVIAAAFPVGSRRLGEKLRRDPAITMLFGFAVLVCTPVAAVILAITIIGIPVALAVLLLYAVMLIVGYAALAVALGDSALARLRTADAGRRGWRAGAAVAAMLAMALLAKIPVVGNLLVVAALLAGVGALVLAFRREDRAEPGLSPA